MLEENLKTQLKGYLDRLVQPVEIVASLDDGAQSREMLELLQDIVSLSPLVTLDPARDAAQVMPSFALRRPGQEPHVRFAGLPMGHEFTSLVLALLQAGGHPSKALPAVLEQIRGLEGEFNFETFVSLSCQSCPDVVQALNLMAVVNPKIRHTMIDGALFQDEVERREVMAVPAVFLERPALRAGPHGARGNPLQARRRRGGARRWRKFNAKAPYDVLVVGGGPAGAAAAIYAARKGIRTGIAAERLGGQLLDTVGIENFISVKETEGHKLATGLEQHVTTYDVDVMNLQRAEALTPGDLIEVRLEQRRGVEGEVRGHRDRRALARDQCAGRAGVPEPRSGVLPALRRTAVQGQAGCGDRRRQLRRRGGDRSGRPGQPRDGHRVRRASCAPTPC